MLGDIFAEGNFPGGNILGGFFPVFFSRGHFPNTKQSSKVLKAASTLIYLLMVFIKSNTFFSFIMTIDIPFMLSKSNRVGFEKYKSGIYFVS